MAQASPTTEEYTNTVVRHLQDESMVAFHHLKLSCRLKGCDRTHPYALPIICCKNCENERIESITQLRKERKQQFEEAVKKHRQEKGTLHDEMDHHPPTLAQKAGPVVIDLERTEPAEQAPAEQEPRKHAGAEQGQNKGGGLSLCWDNFSKHAFARFRNSDVMPGVVFVFRSIEIHDSSSMITHQ